MKLECKSFSWMKEGRCGKCGIGYFRFANTGRNGVLLNDGTKSRVLVKDFWIPITCCDNPFCEWSSVKKEVDAYKNAARKSYVEKVRGPV